MTYAYYFFFFIFTLVSKLWVGRQNELYQMRLGFICLFLNQSDMGTFKVGTKNFQMFAAELT